MIKTFNLMKEYLLLNLKTFFEYKYNTFIQSFGMFISNFFWIFFFYVLFSNAGDLKGWGFNDSLMVMAILTLSFGLSVLFFGNWGYMSKIIIDGRLDVFLTKPVDTLFHVLINKGRFSAFGDIFSGLVFFLISGFTLTKFLLFLILSCTSCILFTSTMVLFSCLTFYIGRSDEIVTALNGAFMSFTMYPSTIFTGVVKLVLYTLIPAFFISNIPINLLKDFNSYNFIILLIFTIVYTGFVYFVFNHGLKHYKSGNLVNINT